MATQIEMDHDVEDAATYLSCTTLTVDRCRHESIDETTLWFFDADKRQIGCASRIPGNPVGDYRWTVTRMLRGEPVARRSVATLLDVCGDMMRFEPQHA